MSVNLVREPQNPYDPNAIAVMLPVRAWFTLFLKTDIHIGYIKRARAKSLSKRIDAGGRITSAEISSMYTDLDHPRISLRIVTDW